MADNNKGSAGSAGSQQFARLGTSRVVGRRHFLGAAGLAGMAGVAMAVQGFAQGASAAIPIGEPMASCNVIEFGAKGDAKADNTAAFQKALDAVHSAGGGSVHVPAGKYLFKGHLDLPSETALVGSYAGPPAGFFGQLGKGTVLLPTEGRGKPEGTAFINALGVSSTVRGLAIYYPEQLAGAAEPTPYPWTIQNIGQRPAGRPPLGGDGIGGLSVMDVNISNAYQGLSLAKRHYVARVYGRPILTGIYVDECEDVGRIENVHFVWSFWQEGNGNPRMAAWIQDHGTAFRFGRSDAQYVFNTFCFQYYTGYHFVQTPSGACYGNFLGLGADTCHYPLKVDAAETVVGLQITNGEFAAYLGSDPQGFVVGPGNTGQVCMTNCAFWGGNLKHFGTVRGTGAVSLIGCNFNGAWDMHNHGDPAILCDGAPTIISNCRFQPVPAKSRRIIAGITKRCAGAVITGNITQGDTFTVDRSGELPPSKFQIHSNIAVG